MSEADQTKWDAKYGDRELPDGIAADEWLLDAVRDLEPGRALELACGLGDNAIGLAELGWEVDAVDISPVGLALARERAVRKEVTVNWIAGDLDEFTPIPDAYDLVVVMRFLDRVRLPLLVESALEPGGRLVYETFLRTELDRPGTHLRNPAFTLAPGELPTLYSALNVVEYDEVELPERTVARLVARKGS